MSQVLFDQDRLALWSRFQELAGQGVRSIRPWRPQDGFDAAQPEPAHQHPIPSLLVCLAGQVRVEGRRGIDLQPGDALLFEPGCWHRHPPLAPGAMAFSLGFLAGRCDLKFADHRQAMWGVVAAQPYRDWIGTLLEETDADARRRLIDAILDSMAGERIAAVSWPEPGVQRMAAWMWRHLHERVDSQALLAHAGLSRSTGFRAFKRFFGRSPQQELQALRGDLGRHLLRRGFSVAEAARRSGFASASGLHQAVQATAGA